MSLPNSSPDEARERLVNAIRAMDAARGLAALHASVQECIGPLYTLDYSKAERAALGLWLDQAEPERSESVLKRLWSERRAREAGNLSAWRSRTCGILAALRRLDDRHVKIILSYGTSGKVLSVVGAAVNRAADRARKEGRPLAGDPMAISLAVLREIENTLAPPDKPKKVGLARNRAITDQIGRLATAAEKAAGEEGLNVGRFATNVDRAIAAALAEAEASADPANDASASASASVDPASNADADASASADPASNADASADPDPTAPAKPKRRRVTG